MSSKAEILSKLNTASKLSLVHAINELADSVKFSKEDRDKLLDEIREELSGQIGNIDGGTW